MYILRGPYVIEDWIHKVHIRIFYIVGRVRTGSWVSRSGLTVEKNERLRLPGIELRFHGWPARIPLTAPIILSRLTAAQIQQTILYSCTVTSIREAIDVQRNIEARSYNNCCSGKAISLTHS